MTTSAHAQWQRRADRAHALAARYDTAREPLRFYAALAHLQQRLVEQHREVIRQDGPTSVMPFVDRLDTPALAGIAEDLVSAVRELSPSAAHTVHHDSCADWQQLVHEYWTSGGRAGGSDIRSLVVELLLQPFAAAIAQEAPPIDVHAQPSGRCPRCTGDPIVALLREEGHGARRSFVCGLCLTEWPALRLNCPACGESGFESLPVFRAEEFPAVRVDACDRCRVSMKTIDLTRDGAADPIVDDLASLPLDLWAREQGYRRLRPNVLRL